MEENNSIEWKLHDKYPNYYCLSCPNAILTVSHPHPENKYAVKFNSQDKWVFSVKQDRQTVYTSSGKSGENKDGYYDTLEDAESAAEKHFQIFYKIK